MSVEEEKNAHCQRPMEQVKVGNIVIERSTGMPLPL